MTGPRVGSPRRLPRRPRGTALLWLVPLIGAGCAESVGDTADTGDATGRMVPILEANNARVAVDISTARRPLAAGQDARLAWGALTRDLLGRPLDPASGVASATLYRFHGPTDAELLEGLERNDLGQHAVTAFWTCLSGASDCALTDFDLLGHPFVPAVDFAASTDPWLLALRGSDRGTVAALALLGPEDEASASALDLDDATATARVTSDLGTLATLEVGPDAEIDWTDLPTDTWGNPLATSRLNRVRLDRLAPSPASAGDPLADLDARSIDHWEAETEGRTTLSLADLEGETPLPDLDPEATWLLTAWCDACMLDLPHIATVLVGTRASGTGSTPGEDEDPRHR